MTRGLAEILKEVSSKNSKKEKVEALAKERNNAPLKLLLSYIFHPNVEWLLPKGKPPYKPLHKAEDAQGSLIGRVTKLGIFVKNGGYDHLKDFKREQIFIQWLESMDPDDAELLVFAKDHRRTPYNGITPNLIEQAWPGFTKTWEKKDE